MRLLALLFVTAALRSATLEKISLPSFFFYEENVGQADPDVRLLMRNGPHRAYFTAGSIHLFNASVGAQTEVRFAARGRSSRSTSS